MHALFANNSAEIVSSKPLRYNGQGNQSPWSEVGLSNPAWTSLRPGAGILFEGPCFLDVRLAVPRDSQFNDSSIVVIIDDHEHIWSG